MLSYLTLIFCCQLAGELVTRGLDLPVPGPVLGMVLLLYALKGLDTVIKAAGKKVGSKQ